MEVLHIQNALCENTDPLEDDPLDEELIDTLIAISVVSKRIADRLRKNNDKSEKRDYEKKSVLKNLSTIYDGSAAGLVQQLCRCLMIDCIFF